MKTDPGERQKPWLRLPSENDKNYARFLLYRNLPPLTRSFEQAYAAYLAAKAELNGETSTPAHRPPPSWYKIANRYQWRTRAAAWDDYQAAILLKQEEEEAAAIRKKRRSIIEKHMDKVDRALTNAAIDAMEPDALRRYLPDLFNALEKLLRASRAEAGEPTEITAANTTISGKVEITSDDIRQALDELKEAGFDIVPEIVKA